MQQEEFENNCRTKNKGKFIYTPIKLEHMEKSQNFILNYLYEKQVRKKCSGYIIEPTEII